MMTEQPKGNAAVVRSFGYVFPAIRGFQAGREYYVSMCPMRLLPKIFLFNEEELVPELRAQRLLNKSRVPEMARYLTENPDSYIFSAITASVDSEMEFEPHSAEGDASRIGLLRIPMSARFVINDGQHRRAAIEAALLEKPELGDESIAVVFFLDIGLERSQQMFADLNRYAIRPSTSLGVLYDHRDERAKLVKHLVINSPVFRDVVEMEKSTLSLRSRRLFTLSSIYRATIDLLDDLETDDQEKRAKLAVAFWEEVAKHIKEWGLVREGKMSSGEVRQDFIHSHAVVLQALARMGNTLLQQEPDKWRARLKPISKIDWRRANATLWEGRALLGGRVSKSHQNVILTTNAIKMHLGLPLSPDEQRIEDFAGKGGNGEGKS